MNWDIVQGKWDQLKGSIREKWADLTDDDVEYMRGGRDQAVGRLQERYGWAKQDAETKVDDFFRDR